MIERQKHTCFALESREPIGIGGEGSRQDLDRNLASELPVARPKGLPPLGTRYGGRPRRFFRGLFPQFTLRVSDVTQPLPRVLLEAATQQMADRWRKRRRECLPVGLSFEDRRDRVRDRLPRK